MNLGISLTHLGASERTRFIYTFIGFMCVAAAALVARTAGDALFLSRYSPDLLSYMYIGTAAVVILASITYGANAGRIPIDRLIVRTCGMLVLLTLGLRIALFSPRGEFRIAAYLLGDLVVNVPMMLFWSFAALVFNPREAKHLLGFVGAGGTFACILTGFLIRPVADRLGTENLLVLVALLIGGFLLTVVRLSRLEAARLQPSASGGQTGGHPSAVSYYAGLLRTRQIRCLVFLILAATLALTLIDYQFKAGARHHYQGAELAGFFGNFYAGASVVALVLQLFLVHRILQKGGVLLGLSMLPAGLLLTSLGTAFTAHFSWMIATKFTVQIFAFTVDSAALQMLYLGIPKQSRSQARAFAEGICKPISMAAAGIALVGLVRVLPLHFLAIGGAALSLIWLLLTRVNARAYVSALVDSIGARRFDPSQETAGFLDKTFKAHMQQAFDSSSDDEIAYLLDMLSEMDDADWAPEFRSLLQRDNPSIKIAALTYLQERGNQDDTAAILRHIGHPDPDVRAAAVYAAAALDGQNAIEDIEQILQDSHPTVQAAAIAALINSGDLDRLLAAGAILKEMLQSETADVRTAAADALAHIQSAGLIRPLIGLLRDPEEGVRLAALEACKNRPDPQLIPAVIPLLADPSTALAAVETLSEFGPEALDHLIPYLECSGMEGAFGGAHRVPEVLARIGDRKALPALLRASEAGDLNLRGEAIRAYCRLLQSGPSVKPYLPDIRTAIMREIASADEQRKILQEVAPLSGTEILCDSLRQDYDSHLQNAFALLDVQTADVDMQTLYLNLTGQADESRANALEILDNVLEGDLKSALLGLLEPSASSTTGSTEAATARICDLLKRGASTWVTIGGLQAAAANRLEDARETIRKNISHAHPIVRETARYALDEIDSS